MRRMYLATMAAAAQEQTAASSYHVERTFSEFQLSAYAAPGGAPPNATIAKQRPANRCRSPTMPVTSA